MKYCFSVSSSWLKCKLTFWHQTTHMLCHRLLGSSPKWCSVCIGQLWPFLYYTVGFSPFCFYFFC